MLTSDVIQSARYLLGDDFASLYRWEDANMITKVSDAVADLLCRRADLLLEDDGTLNAGTLPTATGSALPVDETYLMPLSHHVAYQCLMEDGSDQQNVTKAEVHMRSYLARLQ